MLKQRAADAAERIMQSIEDRRCVLKEDLTREILTTLENAEAAYWSSAEPPPVISRAYPASHFFRLAARARHQGDRAYGDNMMKKGFKIMLAEGRLTREEFRALMFEH